ncbi:MAG: Co2+/Mg2+ efflux protein ApaG [Bacteroidetes bacterium]|nr:MAG: Co2+/Mg2+ efflux protein ApaG [Bacteroidota bacterium]
MIPYTSVTENIRVTVRPVYLDGRSDVINRRFVFGYFIRIENGGTENVQLLKRHWFIHDANDNVQEVEGDGVIGVQPIISPGQRHEYNSFCVLETFTGFMEGHYIMESEQGEQFHVAIPRFDLSAASN